MTPFVGYDGAFSRDLHSDVPMHLFQWIINLRHFVSIASIKACIQDAKGLPFRTAPAAIVEHPYWNGGHPKLSRFYNWAFGDGLLLDKYPNYTYTAAPNATELLLLMSFIAAVVPAAYTCGALLVSSFLEHEFHTKDCSPQHLYEDSMFCTVSSSSASLEQSDLPGVMGKSPFGFPHVWSTILALIAAALIAQVADCLLICTDLVYRAAKSRSSTPSSRDIILERAGLDGTCDVYMLCEVCLLYTSDAADE